MIDKLGSFLQHPKKMAANDALVLEESACAKVRVVAKKNHIFCRGFRSSGRYSSRHPEDKVDSVFFDPL